MSRFNTLIDDCCLSTIGVRLCEEDVAITAAEDDEKEEDTEGDTKEGDEEEDGDDDAGVPTAWLYCMLSPFFTPRLARLESTSTGNCLGGNPI